MTVSVPLARPDSPWAAKYEALRRHALQKSSSAGHDGLVLLLRQGVVAWMTGCSTIATSRRSSAEKARPIAASHLSNEMEASFVKVMATMALAGPYQEICA